MDEEFSDCVCGDGKVTDAIGEECEDGGTADGDDCSPTCKEQRVLEVAGGYYYSCARLSGGIVKCWGYNQFGQLGLGDTQTRGDMPGQMGSALPKVDLGPGQNAVAISAADNHACALISNGTVKCWGINSEGQLGLGDMESRGHAADEMGDALPNVDLGSGKIAIAIAAGYSHTCALLAGGAVKCWGSNYSGQLGLGDQEDRGDAPGEMGDALPAIDLGPGQSATAIAAGAAHVCALLAGGAIKCWGENHLGQLGLGDNNDRGDQPGEMGSALPTVNLGSGQKAAAITAGAYHNCALLMDGAVKCWGLNGWGELGLGDTQTRGSAPSEMGDTLPTVNLGPGQKATAITAGAYHNCALLVGDAVKCWGRNSLGQLGIGDDQTRGDGPGEMSSALPTVNLGSGQSATAIMAGSVNSCALLATGALKCWGDNVTGQLGLGDTQSRGDNPGEMGDALPTVKLFSDLW
ncbi:hypothetical protein [Polyangium aurulentum]|uniref:RCC1 domain-containing protein n=1 Tax=Polyangium aurulentum TaxID=2567896 RepID=UPI00146E29A0|nr:hypothetical protein [Polyangium aurulentum]UQA63895.1 hypothetical protein E8A73_035170 [Polyangium aurulentum]